MRELVSRTVPVVAAAALAFAVAPGTVNAQEKQHEGQEAKKACTAEVTPEAIPTNQEAVAVQVKLSQDIGTVVELEALGESQLALASPDQIREKTELAREEETPQPIKMSRTGEHPSATVWLNTTEATEGNHEVVLTSENDKTCKARILVGDAEER